LKVKPHVLALIVGCCAALTTAACRPDRVPGQLVVVTDSPIRSLDPRLAVDSASAKLSRLVFDGLTAIDERGLPVLVLAESIEPGPRVDDRGRPLSYAVRIRKDRRFHDGSPLTGRDVAYTYQSVMDPAFGAVISGAFRRRFRSVRVAPDDPYLVHFDLRRPLATFRTDIVLGIAPAWLADRPRQRFGGDGTEADGLPIGTGPWRIVPPYRVDRVVIERVAPLLQGSLPRGRDARQGREGAETTSTKPRRLVFRAITDEGSRALSILGGGADVAIGGLSPAVLDSAERSGKARVVRAPGIAWAYLGMNLRHDKLADRRVRRAIASALDRRHIIDSLLGGRARVAEGMMAPEHWAHTKLPDTAHDPALSGSLLDDAGLPPGSDGKRLKLSLKVSTNRLRRAVGRAVGRALGEVGVDVTVRSFELGTFLADVRAGRFELFLLLLPEPLEPDFLAWMFHSQNAPTKRADPTAASPYARIERRALPPGVFSNAVADDPDCGPWSHDAVAAGLRSFLLGPIGLAERHGSANRTSYHQPMVDCLLELGRATLDPGERKRLYGRAQRLIAADVPVVPLWFEDQAALVRHGVTLPRLTMDGRYHVLADATLEPNSP